MHFRPVLITAGTLIAAALTVQAADSTFTRVYMLRNIEAPACIRVLNFAAPDTSKLRILSGSAKKLVVTDTAPNQDFIAELLPIIDQQGKETDPRRAHMEIVVRVANYMNQRKKALPGTASPAASAAPTGGSSGPAQSYDTKRSTQPYKSVYSDEDTKLMKKPRVITDDPVLPSINNLQLKGIFLINPRKPIALLTYESVNFTARDGGLYYMNKTRMKGISTEVLKDKVIVTGVDRIPRELKFKTSL